MAATDWGYGDVAMKKKRRGFVVKHRDLRNKLNTVFFGTQLANMKLFNTKIQIDRSINH